MAVPTDAELKAHLSETIDTGAANYSVGETMVTLVKTTRDLSAALKKLPDDVTDRLPIEELTLHLMTVAVLVEQFNRYLASAASPVKLDA